MTADILAAAEEIKAAGKSKPRKGRHPVNQPMIDHWLDAIGDRNPIYVDDNAARAAGHEVLGPLDHGPPVGYWGIVVDPDGHNLELAHGQEVGFTVTSSRAPAEAPPEAGTPPA